jgi:hypothetical protein
MLVAKRGDSFMNAEFLMIEEMKKKYPDEWLLIVDCELSQRLSLKRGKL